MAVIEVNDVQKKFKMFFDKGQSLKEKLLFQNRNRYEARWVLKGISFNVEKGEAVGLIGENGSGKSTLLKLMTKIMYPDQGSITIQGRVSSLIELGAGFHPDMSGRENIYTNASIFGLTHREIDARIDDIIEFSELREFIDNPVRTYSSGMYMRLAFSVAIHVDADVLLVDEILAVGDASFQAKCFNKMREIKASGETIVIVSHALGQIEQICDRSIWIKDGVIHSIGKPYEVHPAYMEFMGEKNRPPQPSELAPAAASAEEGAGNTGSASQPQQKNRWGNQDVEITDVSLLNAAGNPSAIFKTGEPMRILIRYAVHSTVNNPVVGVGFFRNDGVHCYGTNTQIDRVSTPAMDRDGCVTFDVNKNNLLEGEYLLDVAIQAEDGFSYDYIRGVSRFRMYAVASDIGVVRLDHTWHFD
ncbi:MAG: ABC transporter ATP-binding protein, partial [Firmicutes bacterium]|nr:ABC transporter ATP-binding protein [Bacillota bacterium]